MSRLSFLLVICFFAVVIAKGGRGRGGGGSRGRSYSRGSGSHTYPSSTGLSGNSVSSQRASNAHTYPESSGKSGNNQKSTSYTQNNVHNHYHYSPPQHISYGSRQHPVFVGNPPSYVYVYKNSGSRYNNLLTGLALYNLGRMSNSHRYYGHHSDYSSTPGEICLLGISKTNGDYEETRINCKLMSSFIWDAKRENEQYVTNVTKTSIITELNDIGNSTVTHKNTTIVEAWKAKGPSIKVSPGMECFMIHKSRDTSTLRRNVDCGLLQEYASKSLRYQHYAAGCARVVPVISILVPVLITLPG
ncbi:jg7340 [Pararge aegeria aegeria]|uniref:Jg7340 protein n=1 Tax=Pararge aegeria aegeria TaxID=348720 RepID=A0A8S4REY8_9NEOP|nr:jg7340 [Pararge aegeria aegeria]